MSAVSSSTLSLENLTDNCRVYLDSNQNTSKPNELYQIIKEVILIQNSIQRFSQSNDPEQLKKCSEKLKKKLIEIYKIKESDALIWASEKIEKGFNTNSVDAAAKAVLQEYRTKWDIKKGSVASFHVFEKVI